jgi:hypothetical protein
MSVSGDFTGTERFAIERHLGAGSMGAVYLAYDRKLESRVALKVLLSVDATNIYRFKNEFRALADVTHPNLVTLHEMFSEGDRWFFTMQFLDGQDLLTFILGDRRRSFRSSSASFSDVPADGTDPIVIEAPLKGLEMLFPTPLENEDRLRSVLMQVVEGLQAVHAAGKLHRDLKPENILVSPDGHATLLDFGIVMDQQRGSHETLASIIGTPAYMSPEQCRGQGISEATDWYSLGVILYEALTGDVPFDGAPMQVIARKQEVDACPPCDVVSGVPEDLNTLCMQLLQRDPAARPRGDAILRALQSHRPASLPAPSATGAAKVAMAFVGRKAQLSELEAARLVTEASSAVVALVHGPAGIGKTTLVNHFIKKLIDESKAVVLRGRCYERESLPFKAFDNVIDSVTRYLRKLPAVDAARMLPRDIDALAELFPVLKRVEVVRRNRRPRALPTEPQEVQKRAFRALKEMFCRIADVEPLVIYIDDLHWTDIDSARLLGELIVGDDRPSMMLICVFRSGDDDQNPGLSSLLEQVRRAPDMQVRDLAVGVLGPEDSVELAGALLGTPTADEGARKVGFESGGNPQMLTQLVRHVEERRASGRASPETARGMISFERVLEQRLASLSTDARTLLELLSVSARPVPESMLTLVSSFNIDLSTALGELRGSKLIRGIAVHDVRAVEVYHDTIREAVASAMPVEVLVSWHRRLAAALEASGAIDLEALTDHLLGAGDKERASLYAGRAAAQAEKSMAFDKAARLYGVAAVNCLDAATRSDLRRRWADALVCAGRGAESADAYVQAAAEATGPVATELMALAGVQLMLSGDLARGLEILRQPLRAINVELPASFEQASLQAVHMWRDLRARGFAFRERTEAELDKEELRRFDLLWGVTRGLLLNELGRPLPLIVRCALDALELGEPSRIVRALALFQAHADTAFSVLAKLAPSGAMDVAEALARRLDQVEARAAISYAKGVDIVYATGHLEPGLQALAYAEELYRNHCRGCAHEMRQARMMITQISLAVKREGDMPTLREWVREAEDRGDRLSAVRLRLSLSLAALRADDSDAALLQIDTALKLAGGTTSGLAAVAEPFARANLQLYRGSADGCRASNYLLEDFFSGALAWVPVWRSLILLLRARLALIARAAAGAPRDLLRSAAINLGKATRLASPCMADDVQLVRAGIAAAEGKRGESVEALSVVLESHAGRSDLPLTALFAMRAKGQLTGGVEGRSMVERAEDLLLKRGVVNPRRFARLFVPGVEEMALAFAKKQAP